MSDIPRVAPPGSDAGTFPPKGAAKYQVMPDLTADERADLYKSIAERGFDFAFPVVTDEHGNILDGHNRSAIAEELGLLFVPTIVKAGLSESEKYVYAAEVNMTRRNLTKWQRALIYMRMKPHYDALAEANSRTGTTVTNGTVVGRSTDATASAAGLGSGRTAERAVKVVEEVQAKAPDLIPALNAGDIDLKDASKELRQRQKAAEPEPESTPLEIVDLSHEPALFPRTTQREPVVGDIPPHLRAQVRQPTRAESACDRITQLTTFTDIPPDVMARAAVTYRPVSSGIALNQIPALMRWLADVERELRKEASGGLRLVRSEQSS